MACGKPIMAVANGQTKEIIEDAKAGMVFTPSEKGVEDMASFILSFEDKIKLFTKYGENGRKYAEEYFSWEKCAISYEKIINTFEC